MKLFRNSLWLIVTLLVLQVLKVLFSRQAFAGAALTGVIIGCAQFFMVTGWVVLFLFAWIGRRFFHVRKPFAAAGIVFGTLVIGMECLFAWWMHHPARIPLMLRSSFAYYYDYFQEDLLQFDSRYAVYDKDLYYTLKPDTSFDFRNIEFMTGYRTNSLGLRDDAASLSGPQVACIGDSYTMGWGVGQEESFPARLRSMTGLRVANMGVASYGTARELINLQRLDASKLEWVIIQYCSNDLVENKTCVQHGYRLPISSRESYEGFVRQAALSRKYFPGKYFLIIANYFLKSRINRLHRLFALPWERKDGMKGQEAQAGIFLDILSHSAIDLSKVGVIVTFMDDHDSMKGDFLRAVQRLSMEGRYRERFGGKLHVLDAAPLLGGDDLYLLDVHFRAAGHGKIAAALRDIIRKGR